MMLMLNATYSFFLGAGRLSAHGIDVATPDENVTLAERPAR